MTRLLSFGRLLLFALLVGGLSLSLIACDSGGGMEEEEVEATISGVVTDADAGDPVEGATVTGTDADTDTELFETETDALGEYETAFTVDDEPSQVALQADAEGYEAAEEAIPFAEEMTENLSLAPATSGEATVYTALADGEIHQLTPGGKREWAYTGYDSAVNVVAVDADGFVYTAPVYTEVHKLTPGGEREWRAFRRGIRRSGLSGRISGEPGTRGLKAIRPHLRHPPHGG
jgi:hypothetical protein